MRCFPQGVGDGFLALQKIFRLDEIGVIGALGDEEFLIASAVETHDFQPADVTFFFFLINLIPRLRLDGRITFPIQKGQLLRSIWKFVATEFGIPNNDFFL